MPTKPRPSVFLPLRIHHIEDIDVIDDGGELELAEQIRRTGRVELGDEMENADLALRYSRQRDAAVREKEQEVVRQREADERHRATEEKARRTKSLVQDCPCCRSGEGRLCNGCTRAGCYKLLIFMGPYASAILCPAVKAEVKKPGQWKL